MAVTVIVLRMSRLVGLGGRRGPGDVDVCTNGGVWEMVACCGVERE